MYEGGIRVPLLAWFPGHIKAGVTTDHVSAFWDMMPTFAGIIGCELLGATDGISFLPTLFSEENQQAHNFLYWEFHEQGGRQAVRKDNWKLIRQSISDEKGPWLELYNLDKDIHEDTNLVTEEPEKAKELVDIMDKARTESKLFNFGK